MPYVSESKGKKTKLKKTMRVDIDEDFQPLDEMSEEDGAGALLTGEGRTYSLRSKARGSNESVSEARLSSSAVSHGRENQLPRTSVEQHSVQQLPVVLKEKISSDMLLKKPGETPTEWAERLVQQHQSARYIAQTTGIPRSRIAKWPSYRKALDNEAQASKDKKQAKQAAILLMSDKDIITYKDLVVISRKVGIPTGTLRRMDEYRARRPEKQKRTVQQDKAKAKQLLLRPHSVRAIAKETGVSEKTLHTWKKDIKNIVEKGAGVPASEKENMLIKQISILKKDFRSESNITLAAQTEMKRLLDEAISELEPFARDMATTAIGIDIDNNYYLSFSSHPVPQKLHQWARRNDITVVNSPGHAEATLMDNIRDIIHIEPSRDVCLECEHQMLEHRVTTSRPFSQKLSKNQRIGKSYTEEERQVSEAMKAKSTIREKKVAEAKRLLTQGDLSLADIGRNTGISQSTMVFWPEHKIWVESQTKRKARDPRKAKAVEMSMQGISQNNIAKQLGTSKTKVSQWIKEAKQLNYRPVGAEGAFSEQALNKQGEGAPRPAFDENETTTTDTERARAQVEHIRQRGNWNNIGGDLIPEMLTRLPGFENIRLLIYRDDDTHQPWHDSAVVNPDSANARHTIRLRYNGSHYDTLLDTGQVIKIKPDGDCFFRAMLQALTPQERLHIVGKPATDDEAISVLRNNVADWFLASPERLAYVASVTQDAAAGSPPEPTDMGEVNISLTRSDSVSSGSGRGSPESIPEQEEAMRAGTGGEVLLQSATGYVLWDQIQLADGLNQEGLCAGLVNSVMARLDQAPELTLIEVIEAFARETREDNVALQSRLNMAQRKGAAEPYRHISAQTSKPFSTFDIDALMAAIDLHITLGSARNVAAELRIISQSGKQDHVIALYRTRRNGNTVFDIYDPNNGAFRYLTGEAFLNSLEGYITRRGPSEMILRPLFIGETVTKSDVTPTYPALPYPCTLQPFPAVNPAELVPDVSQRFASVRLNPDYGAELMSGDLLDRVQQAGMLPARLVGNLQGADITSTQQLQQLRLLLQDLASRSPFQTDNALYRRVFSLLEQQITYATENRLSALADMLTEMLLDIHPDHLRALCERKEGDGERYFELLEKLSRNEYTGAEMCQRIITRLVGTDTDHDNHNSPLILALITKNLRGKYFSSEHYCEWPERLWSILYHTASRLDQEQGINRVIRLMLAERWSTGQHTKNLYALLTKDDFGKRFSLPRQLLPTDEQLGLYIGKEQITLQKQLATYHETAPEVLSPVDLLSEAETALRKILLISDPAQRLKATSAWLLEALNRQDPQLFNTCASALVRPRFTIDTLHSQSGGADRKAWLEQLARLAQEPLTSKEVISQILHTLFGAESVLYSSINSGLAGAALMPLIWRAADDAVNRLDGARRDIMIHLLTTRYRDTVKMIFFNRAYTGYEALLKEASLRNTLPREFIPQDVLLEKYPLRNKYRKRLRAHSTRAASVAGIPVRSQPDIFRHSYPEGDINDPLKSLTAETRAATYGEQLQARQDETNVRLGAFYTTSLPVAESDFLRNDMVVTHRQLLRTDLLLANIWSAEMQEYIPPLVSRLLKCRIIIHKENGDKYDMGGRGKFSLTLSEKQGKGYSVSDDDDAPVVGFFQAFLMVMPAEMKQALINRGILDSPAEGHARQLAYFLSDHISAHPEFIDKVIEETVPADKNELRYLSSLLSRVMTGSSDADLDIRESLYLCARVIHNGTEEDKARLTGILLTPAFISALKNNVSHPGVATAYFGLLDIAFRMPGETITATIPGGAALYAHLAEGCDALIHALLSSAECEKTTFEVYFSLLRRAIAAQAHSQGSSEEAVRHHTRMAWLKWGVYKTIPRKHTYFMATLLHSAGLLPTDEEIKAYVKVKNSAKGWLAVFGSETSDACKRLARHANAACKTETQQHTDGDITSLGLLRYSQQNFHTSQIQTERLARIEKKAIRIIQSAIEAKVKVEVGRLISEQYLAAAKKLEADYPLLSEASRLAEQMRKDARNPSPELVERYSKEVAEQIFKERSREFIPHVQQQILQYANLLPLAQTYDPEQGAMVLPRYADYIASSSAFSSIVSGLLTGAVSGEGIFHHPALLIRHPDSGPVVSDQRLSEVVTALNQQMPQYHFSMAAEHDATSDETTRTAPVLRLRSPAPLITNTEPLQCVPGFDAGKLTADKDMSSAVISGEPIVETTRMPAIGPSRQTEAHLPPLPTLSPPSVASTVSPALTAINLPNISHVHVEAPATKISQVMNVHGRISSGIISQTVTLPPASGESGAGVRALYPGGNVHILENRLDENVRLPPVFPAVSGQTTRTGAHIVSLSDILPAEAGGRAAEHTPGDRATNHRVRQYFSEVNTILSSCQNPIKLTPENEAIRADVARRTQALFTPELMTAMTSRHNILHEATREIIHNNNIAIVKSGQYENLIRMEGAPVDARMFSDKVHSGDPITLDTTARNIAQNAPAWREELRAEQEAKYLEAKRKAEEEERMRQEEKRSEEESVKQEKKRSEEEGAQQEEKRGENGKKEDKQPAVVKR